jgi:DNA-directed RNA polymerase subunit RPC12/RpoP
VRRLAAGLQGLKSQGLLQRNTPVIAQKPTGPAIVATLAFDANSARGGAISKHKPKETDLGFKCIHCDNYFPDVERMKSHISEINQKARLRGVAGLRCVVPGCHWEVYKKTKTKVNDHTSRHIPTLPCPELDCPIQWVGATKHDLAFHTKAHHDIPPKVIHTCSMCKKEFARPETMKRHERYNCPDRQHRIVWICPVLNCSRHDPERGYNKIPALAKHLLSHKQDTAIANFAQKLQDYAPTNLDDNLDNSDDSTLLSETTLSSQDLEVISAQVPSRRKLSKSLETIVNAQPAARPNEHGLDAHLVDNATSSTSVLDAGTIRPTLKRKHLVMTESDENQTGHDSYAAQHGQKTRTSSLAHWLGRELEDDLKPKQKKTRARKKSVPMKDISSFFGAQR